ncbi:MAG: helicase [Nitrospinae bacterium]|nr:helicase [Nitrospinota bacterium]
MPKLRNFRIKIETGDPGTQGPVKFSINSHTLPLENVKGSPAAGQTLEGGFEVNSFAHSLTLVGPEEGRWNIKKMTVDYENEGAPPYLVAFGEVTLDETTEVNIWRDPPLPVYDV